MEDVTPPDLRAEQIGPRAAPTPDLLTAATAAYGLPIPTTARDLGGAYNLNVLLRSDGGAHVLRVHRPWVTAARLDAVQRTRAALASMRLPVAMALPARDGRTAIAVDGRLAELERYVDHDGWADRPARHAQAFALLGRLHAALPAAAPPSLEPPLVSNYVTPPRLVRLLARAMARLRDQDTPATGAALAACREAATLAERIGAWWRADGARLPVALTHGDYGGGNVLFLNERIVAVLDFDFLAPRERVFELAYTLYWVLLRLYPDVHPERYPWPLVADLLAAYDGAAPRPLSRAERAALPVEMARVPLYWFGEAAFLPDPAAAIAAMASHLPRARWLLDHAADLAGRFPA